ncbi:MAG: SDR family NAD(P)-dependent oxidoreductase [Candidatus Latescibacterota bacterium]|jgi:3-oxoacyl-[acyl-carrier protein] reductase
MKIDLSDRIAVVTGAGGALGRTIARTLGACGADVAAHYQTSQAMAERVVQDIRAMGRRAVAVQADIGDPTSVERLHATVVAELGDADIVVTNAVAFLASDLAKYITGVYLPVAGGNVMPAI